MFCGRTKEINKINDLLSRDGFQSCLIYGRRRLGKTELLKHCLLNKNVKTIYFQAKQSDERSNVDEFTSLIEEEFNLSHLYFNNFIEAFKFAIELSKKERLYIVIDEYPFLRKIINGLDSYLQNIIDFNQDNKNLYLFISGSSASIIEEMIGADSPLYKRFSLKIILHEMDYLEALPFYESFNNEDKIKLYSAFGGVPFYLKYIRKEKSVEDNIIDILSGDSSLLEDDITILLKNELTKINNANAILSAIAYKKAHHYSDILSKTGINSSPVLNEVLDKLMKMDLIKKVSPINDVNNRLKCKYIISSNSIRFYYRYLNSNLSNKTKLDELDFYNYYIKEDFETQFVPKVFEDIVKDYLVLKSKKHELDYLLLDVGTYWYDDPINKRNGEFDVVTCSNEGYRFYEVKYKDKKLTKNEIIKEIEQVNNTSLEAISYGFISKVGFEDEAIKYLKDNNYSYFILEDLFK